MSHQNLPKDELVVGVFRNGFLGDTLVAMPALWTVRKRFPKARLVYITQTSKAGALVPPREVLGDSGIFDSFIDITPAGIRDLPVLMQSIRAVRSERVRRLVYLGVARTKWQVVRDTVFFFVAGVRRFYGVRGCLNDSAMNVTDPEQPIQSEVERMVSYIERDGIEPCLPLEEHLGLGLTEEETQRARRFLAELGVGDGQTVVAMGVGSKMPAKRWPLERYRAVVRALGQSQPLFFLFLGSKGEREDCDFVLQAALHGANAAGNLSVRESAAVLRHCALYIGNDTGTMHLAASERVRCIAIFSSRTNPTRWFPYGPGHVVLRQRVQCSGCELEVCDKDNLCVKLTTEGMVISQAEKYLSQERNRS